MLSKVKVIKKSIRKYKPKNENEFIKNWPTASLETTEQVRILDIDKGRGISRYIMALGMNVTQDCFYRLETSEGILKQLNARSKFSLRPKNLLRIEVIPDYEISLRSIAVARISESSKGIIMCMCKTKC